MNNFYDAQIGKDLQATQLRIAKLKYDRSVRLLLLHWISPSKWTDEMLDPSLVRAMLCAMLDPILASAIFGLDLLRFIVGRLNLDGRTNSRDDAIKLELKSMKD
ncbi:unnamed protein product [Lupinus luteus]|uniref:Uncharacterized protein n=1 Tax=Lupinus luteus TaxID=3873 RepID=A0AAV1VQD0_LUPLU